jgi:aminoglycoside 3-N-acetyltransferase
MSEIRIIELTRYPNTVNSIYNDLKKLGIYEGDIVLVHSSLSSIGWVCGGTQAVIMALLKSIGSGGTLVMPTQSASISDPEEWENPPVPHDWIYDIYENMPAFDPMVTPTEGMGKIPELFRTIPNTIRSNHPQVSFSANGKLAKQITENHELTPGFGMNSPLGKMYELNAKVLLLGVGYSSCTSFHLAESLNPQMAKKRMGTSIMDDGVRVWKWFEDFNYDCDDFDIIGREFEKEYDISTGMVGNAKCKLFDMRSGVDFAKDWLAENRFKNKKIGV